MKNFIQTGVNLTIPAPAIIVSGDVIVVGKLTGIAAADAAVGADLDVVTEGVFALPKIAANVFAVGDSVYYKAADKLVTSTASGNTLIGYATAAAAAGAASVNVKIG